jgi:hypothetical protein
MHVCFLLDQVISAGGLGVSPAKSASENLVIH